MFQHSIKNQFYIRAANSKRSFGDSFRPIYIVSRFFVQMPFSMNFRRGSNGDIDRPIINKLDGVWFVVSISIFIFDASRILSLNRKFLSPISFVGLIFVFGIVHVLGLLAIILDMCYRFKLVNIFKTIIVFDKKINSNI